LPDALLHRLREEGVRLREYLQRGRRLFTEPWKYDVPSTFIGVLFYAVQVYCDFSGYSDMAIATAGFLGYGLTLNFAHPYFSPNIGEHWRRWHISLSTWLRDYLYIPLGGNRGSRWKTNRNLMLVMLIGGLWHGAAFSYIIWGAIQGLGSSSTGSSRG
jgi:alginate O-acetyltransferase complex protein AlgI